MLAWLAMLAMVGLVIWMQAAGRNAPPAPLATTTKTEPPDALITLLGRYVSGASKLAAGGTTAQREQLMTSLNSFAHDPADALRVAIVAGETIGPEAARERLDEIEKKDVVPDEVRTDIAMLRSIYERSWSFGPEASAFVERNGWFGELATSYAKPETDPQRVKVIGMAQRTLGVALGAVLGAGAMGLIGLGVGVVALVLFLKGKITARYAPPAPGGSAYLEAFAIFLLGFMGVAFLSGPIEKATGIEDATRYLIWLLLLCPFYPLVRGARWSSHRYAVGIHAGAKRPGSTLVGRIAREMGAGVVGYIAGLPIFFVGILGTLIVALIMSALAGVDEGPIPSHPLIREVGKGGFAGAVALYLLASVWAPLVEEMMFRGCFYHHLRGWLRPIVSGAIVAFVFAAIHPPGIVAVPALMSLAVVFALIREWRGSIIGCMAAHALHNGTLITCLLLALS